MDDYELLLRHTEAWAKDKKRPLDRDLLETAISLRSFHDVKEAQEWPAGSVEHLMLVRWPSHGPAEEPDVPALIETLDTFWRFLRGTGRMRSGSADPKDLLKEAKRAGAGMREACADADRHSTSKSLMRFAAESGLSLDDVESEEEINAAAAGHGGVQRPAVRGTGTVAARPRDPWQHAGPEDDRPGQPGAGGQPLRRRGRRGLGRGRLPPRDLGAVPRTRGLRDAAEGVGLGEGGAGLSLRSAVSGAGPLGG